MSRSLTPDEFLLYLKQTTSKNIDAINGLNIDVTERITSITEYSQISGLFYARFKFDAEVDVAKVVGVLHELFSCVSNLTIELNNAVGDNHTLKLRLYITYDDLPQDYKDVILNDGVTRIVDARADPSDGGRKVVFNWDSLPKDVQVSLLAPYYHLNDSIPPPPAEPEEPKCRMVKEDWTDTTTTDDLGVPEEVEAPDVIHVSHDLSKP